MEERKNRNSHGFTWGMIVGGAVVLMLTTKKGREILEELAEGGYEGIEEYIDLEKVKELAGQFGEDDEPDIEEKGYEEKLDDKQTPRKKKPRLFRRRK
jgi:hypothetical protein